MIYATILTAMEVQPMSEDKIFILAEQNFARVVSQIKNNQLELALPEWFSLGRSQDRSKLKLRDILNYHAYDTAWIPETFSGKSIEEVGTKYDGDLLSDNPIGSYQKYSDTAIESIKNNYHAELIVHFSYGDLPAKQAITHPTSFRVFRAYDFAKLIDADRALPVDLVKAFQSEIESEIESWRQMGIFQPVLPVPAGADPQAELFAITGRDPNWQA